MRNGMENQGVSLIPRNGGGVDTKDNQENTLLRFFAGCEVLTAKPQEYMHVKEQPKKEKPKPQQEPVVQNPPSTETPNTNRISSGNTITCCLYYPNNYSGVEDDPSYAIDYLIKGIGTSCCVNYLLSGNTLVFDEEKKFFVNNVEKFGSGKIDFFRDFGVQPKIKKIKTKKNTNHCNPPNTCDELCDTNRTFDGSLEDVSDWMSGYEVYEKNNGISVVTNNLSQAQEKTYACNEYSGRYITDSSGEYIYGVMVDDVFLPLAKINGRNEEQSWFYRIDKVYSQHNLVAESYLDSKSYGLNGANYTAVTKVTEFQISPNDDKHKLISFADLYVGILKDRNHSAELSGITNAANVEIVRKLMDSENSGYKIKKITFKGHASSSGYEQKGKMLNTTLANNRRDTFKKWMEACKFPNISDTKIVSVASALTQSSHSNTNEGKNNEELTKLWRSAEVIIEYDVEEKINVQTSQQGSDERINMAIPNNNSSMPDGGLNEVISYDFDKTTFDDDEESVDTTFETHTVNRYDNEGEFFELLSKNDNFMHYLTSHKIRYFDPAFHSISPEGFNARLTFLHQCTRQGPTLETRNFAIGNAYNLAFGRPPVCVLRLGDFFNTRIVINNLSIQYDNPTWDLNPEGIGVMPMFAKVNISFAFIGGSDIAGPISRLQNAVSFNYYANTSIYDDRADRVEYNPNNTGTEIGFSLGKISRSDGTNNTEDE